MLDNMVVVTSCKGFICSFFALTVLSMFRDDDDE